MDYIIIPAYNEEKVIQKTLEELYQEGYTKNIVIIDDCSTDNTKRIATKFGFLIEQKINKGQGAALRTGIKYALEQGAKKIVTFDSDGQHDPKDIKSILDELDKFEVVLGSRFIGQTTNLPLLRRIMLKGSVILCRLFYGLKLTDSHNGLRGFRSESASKIMITEDRMLHASEILQRISEQKLSYTEVPVHIRYTEYSLKKGQSIWNAFNILKGMIKLKIYSKQE